MPPRPRTLIFSPHNFTAAPHPKTDVQKAVTMAITEVAYCTREGVQRALNLADVPRLNERVDAAIMAGARQVEGFLHRRFYPTTKTVLFDQPDGTQLWLYDQELAAAPTSILSGGTPMTIGTDVFLRPRSGPPYRWLEAGYAGSVFWQSVNTPQNAISVTGDFDYPVNTLSVSTLTASVTSSATTMTLASSVPGIGALFLIDSERVLISDKAYVATSVTLAADVAAGKSAVALTVSSGAGLFPGELIVIDSERMYIETVIGNVITVDRAVNGSVLAAHTNGTAIYAPRQATVIRAMAGTTTASHSSGATVSRLAPPSMVSELNLAYAIENEEAALSAYARSATPDMVNRYKDRGLGIMDLEEATYAAYGRKARSRAV